MELLVSAAVGAAVSALLTRGAPPAAVGGPVLTARIPVRPPASSAEETVARLDAMIGALDAPFPRL